MIEVKNLYKSFDNKQVLNDINVLFEQGKTNLIIGQSGSGKTVLLKSIVGLHDIDSGQVIYDDVIFNDLNFKEKKGLRQQIGMLFQGGALFDSSTVEENVMFPLDMFTELSYADKRERANECLKRVNIINANELFPAEISGGMKKRVAIARAIALNPKYLFCDEPNSGLDPITALVIDDLIKEITVEYNMTTIVNTHDMNSVMEIGDKVIFIYEGSKWWEGTKEDIFDSDNVELNNFIFASKLSQKIKDLKNVH
ncbi:MAG: ABC transporter ATP-binding protein [Bacteroidetes bacterium GWA2_31_9b]|nr:MAG: ABC transporter ATP-binding protein [Bacteroidetes bacterium GWA2_31_9b]